MREKGADMVIKQAELEAVCGITSKLPENAYPEVAFAGKSNVGKSSLINSLVNRKALARTSSQPGKTQTINLPDQSGRISGRSAGVRLCEGTTERKGEVGKADRALSARIKAAEGCLFAD